MDLMNSLENNYIHDLITHQAFSSVYLKNGVRLKERLVNQDGTSVLLKAAETQRIYKHRISTIAPETSFSKFL